MLMYEISIKHDTYKRFNNPNAAFLHLKLRFGMLNLRMIWITCINESLLVLEGLKFRLLGNR